MINHRGHREHGVKEFALVRDANGQLVEDGNSGGSGYKTAAKVGLGAAGAAGLAVGGTRGYHYYDAVKAAGKGSFRKGVSNAADYNALRGDGAAEKIIGATAQANARKGWMGKLGKVGNVLTKFSANLKPALRELAARSGRIVEFGDDLEMRAKAAAESMYKGKAKARDVARSADWFMRHPEAIPGDETASSGQLPSGGKTALMGAGIAGLGVLNHKLVKNDPSRFFRHLPKATMAGGLLLAGMGAERLRQERQRNRVSELAARSGRIVEFGDGDADEAVLSALKAVASADESSAQRAMLLKRGLIEMVKGQVVITERGYEMMQKAGVPPKLTPEERREEIAGTEERRLSMFDHRGHREHRVELARGDYAIPAMRKILKGEGDRALHELPGAIGALRGDAGKMQSHFAQLGKRNNYYDQLAKQPNEIQKRLNHIRSYSAKEIRYARMVERRRAFLNPHHRRSSCLL